VLGSVGVVVRELLKAVAVRSEMRQLRGDTVRLMCVAVDATDVMSVD